jgi:predicted hydrocarbon binding protein
LPEWVRVEPVFNYSPSEPTFHVVVELKSTVPGGLGDVLGRLARNKVNLLAVDAADQPDDSTAVASLLLRPLGKSKSAAEIKRVVDSSSFVISSSIEVPESGILVARDMFPIKLPTGHRVMLARTELVSDMMHSIREKFGTGGDVIIYEEGFEAGRNDASNIIKMMGNAALFDKARLLVQVRTALGWGRAEFLEYRTSPYKTKVRVEHSFECEGRRSETPYSQFLRGHFAGLAAQALGKDVVALETKCVATGDPYCEFELEEAEPKDSQRQPRRSAR